MRDRQQVLSYIVNPTTLKHFNYLAKIYKEHTGKRIPLHFHNDIVFGTVNAWYKVFSVGRENRTIDLYLELFVYGPNSGDFLHDLLGFNDIFENVMPSHTFGRSWRGRKISMIKTNFKGG